MRHNLSFRTTYDANKALVVTHKTYIKCSEQWEYLVICNRIPSKTSSPNEHHPKGE